MVSRVQGVHRVIKETKDGKVREDSKAIVVSRVFVAHKETKVIKVNLVRKDLDSKVLLVLKDTKAIKAGKALEDSRAIVVSRVFVVRRVIKETRAGKAIEDSKVILVLKASKATKAVRVGKVN